MIWKPGNIPMNQSKLDSADPDTVGVGMVSDCGVWGIHINSNRVTHIPTKCSAFTAPSFAAAKMYCDKMNRMGDWSKPFDFVLDNGVVVGGCQQYTDMKDADRIARLLVKEQI